MMTLDVRALSVAERQNWLQHAIAPRPVCFASTIDKEGNVNLSPFSFFNLFSTNPAVAIFSPARRARNNTIKHTLENILEVPEVVINICDYDMIQQVSLASCEFPKNVDEFIKAGFTKIDATLVKPPMVKESKVNLECKIIEVKSLGNEGGAGQLVFAEILIMHVNEAILTDDKKTIDHQKLHHIARLGGDWYCVVNKSNLFKVPKPNVKLGIGIDTLPENVRDSKILTGNDLGMLANVHEMPIADPFFTDENLQHIISLNLPEAEKEQKIHLYVKQLLGNADVEKAWQVLLV